MLLIELFKKNVDFEVKTSSKKFATRSTINGREIRFFAVEDEQHPGEWNISFGEVKGNKITAELTGSGGEFEVLTMVKDSILHFIDLKQPNLFFFTASKGDRSRASVYMRMLKRAIPAGWKVELQDASYDVLFVISKLGYNSRVG